MPFKADIRAKTIVPIKPSMDYLVFRNKIQTLGLNSLKTIGATNIKVATRCSTDKRYEHVFI
jgi:hypothetical protein